MSIDIEWEKISSGVDGQILAEKIRSFIHDKFQQIALPRFIRSVEVHSFEFGKTSPQLEIKDICDPLPDFYEQDDDDDDDEEEYEGGDNDANKVERTVGSKERPVGGQSLGDSMTGSAIPAESAGQRSIKIPPSIDTRIPPMRPSFDLPNQMVSPFPRSGTPGIPGGTSNLSSYFHLPLGGISGAQTPLAAVASGTPFANNRSDFFSLPPSSQLHHHLRPNQQQEQTGSPSRPSTADSILTAVSPGEGPAAHRKESFSVHSPDVTHDNIDGTPLLNQSSNKEYEPKPEDLQIVCHVKYAGDVRLSLTAEILLDYPMPSFVGIPLKLSITGLKFDGVAILAHIRKRAHFCFLSPDDAQAVIGERAGDAAADEDRSGGAEAPTTTTIGGLLQEIHVESEIGKKESGKQVLKNVGKVERFVLEQVRRIFEEEFVFPSFWTFLV